MDQDKIEQAKARLAEAERLIQEAEPLLREGFGDTIPRYYMVVDTANFVVTNDWHFSEPEYPEDFGDWSFDEMTKWEQENVPSAIVDHHVGRWVSSRDSC